MVPTHRHEEDDVDTTWDPDRYLHFADERGRPFADLLAVVRAEPQRVLDLGCGPGNLTATLATRWPDATVLGLDASAEMVERAQEHRGPRLRFAVADLREVGPAVLAGLGLDALPDVVVSNATLQWVPGHRALLPRLLTLVAPGGWLAFQVPGNFGSDSHRLLREVAAELPYAAHTGGTERTESHDAADYLGDLSALGCTVDAWETTYLHVLQGEDPVYDWISGTGARPVLQALPDDLRPAFVAEYQRRLRQAYPARPFGTVLPFRRIFVVARTSPAPAGEPDRGSGHD